MMSTPTLEGAVPPLASRSFNTPGLWGITTAMLSNGILFVSLLFGWLYLWTVAPFWSVPSDTPMNLALLVISGLGLSLAVVVYGRGVKRLKKGKSVRLGVTCLCTASLGLAHFIMLLYVLLGAKLNPTQTAHDSLLTVMLIYLLIHSGLATILTAMQAWRVKLGYVCMNLPAEPAILRVWWMYSLGIFWVSFVAFVLFPMAWEVA
jgi:cytochrome c oxidase subunit I+III